MSQNRDEENPIRDALVRALSMDGPTKVFVDTSWVGVHLPLHLQENQDIVSINLSRRYKYPLYFNEIGVIAVLSFRGEYSRVHIPWEAIRCIVAPDGHRTVIEPMPHDDQMFEELMHGPKNKQVQEMIEAMEEYSFNFHGQRPDKPKINVIDGGGLLTPPRRGHLRLVN